MAIEYPKPIAVTPVPNVRYREFTKCGQKPLAGGKIWTYEANSTTPKVTYKDPYGITPNTNPIILDAAGEADIYLNGTYRFVVEDKNGVIQKDVAKIGSWYSGDLDDQMKSVNDLLETSAQTLMQPLQDAINAALAAGAGEGGWNANLVEYKGSTQAAFNDGTNQKTGWIVTVEMFGGEQGLDNSDAFQRAYDFLHTVGGGKLTSSIRKHYITKAVKYYDDIETDLCGAQVICQGAGKFVSALYNADKTASISPYGAEVYYKNAQSITAQNPISALTLDAKKGASSIVVNDASLFKVGDYVFVNNGYCDMWRVMEDYTGSKQDWNQTDIDLWRCEISKIKSIVANTIYFEDQIANDYLVKVKTYGLFADENNRADHVGWNYARIERLGGVYDSKFKNIKFINEGATISLLAFLSVNFNTLNCTFEGTGRGVEYVSCYNSHILGNFSDTTSYGQSIRRGSSMCIMGNATANYVAGDCPLIIWEGSNLCVAKGIGIEGKGGITGHAKI